MSTRPVNSSTSVAYICMAAVAVAYFMFGGKRVDTAETAAIASTCKEAGMVARLEVGDGKIVVFCQKPEEVK